jgi:hypothetical protein
MYSQNKKRFSCVFTIDKWMERINVTRFSSHQIHSVSTHLIVLIGHILYGILIKFEMNTIRVYIDIFLCVWDALRILKA